MEAFRTRRFQGFFKLTCIAAVGAAAAACQPPSRRSGPGSTAALALCPRAGQVAPSFAGDIESIPRARIVEYAENMLRFVHDPHSADQQPLLYPVDTPGVAPRVGPTARVEPERCARQLTRRQLQEGRIIARIISDGEYPPLGLRPGIQYHWVDSTDAGWRSAVIPANAADPITLLELVPGALPHLPRPPAASWYYVPTLGTLMNDDCGSGCCPLVPIRKPPPTRPPGPRPRIPHITEQIEALPATRYGGRPGVPPLP